MTQELLTEPITLSSSSSSSANISCSGSINAPPGILSSSAPFLTGVHYLSVNTPVGGINASPTSLRRTDTHLSAEEKELQILRERCKYLHQDSQSSYSSTTNGGLTPTGDPTEVARPETLPGIPHGYVAPPQFPEINEKGWYVDKPRAQADFPKVDWSPFPSFCACSWHVRFHIKVPYWHRRDWVAAGHDIKVSTAPGDVQGLRGPTRMSQGHNVAFGFLTDIHGSPVDGQRAQTIRRRFREFCVYLYNSNQAPETWQRGIDKDITLAYHHWMRTQCWELQLCEDNWKADKVAVLSNYTQWKKKYEAKLARRAEKAKAAAKVKKTKQARSDPPVAQADQEFDANQAGAEQVQELLEGAAFRLSPDPLDQEDVLKTSARRHTSQSPEATEGPSKRVRRSSSLAAGCITSPTDPTSVSDCENATVTRVDNAPDTMPTAPELSFHEVSFPNPLEKMRWDGVTASPVVAATENIGGDNASGVISPSGTDPGALAPPSPSPGNLPATTSTDAPANNSGGSSTLASLSKGKGKAVATRKGPKPRKVAPSDTVWPPPDDDAHTKLK
ncbi:hypothetical protein BN946_scf184544.g2 [Trametes cinnabarina]|uniref:Uncharacterized protein n=1 Tax=Pycnoporus cinnabarinus TaxID=5643 RepID=A0A060SZZ2_PYCCI|nr:hypothetical protein BN946_scf184544.g2 [Trametes cinnabarina]